MDLTPLGPAANWLAGASIVRPYLEKILGQPLSEIGGIISDPISQWRESLQKRRRERMILVSSGAAQQVKDSGAEPIKIPDYIVVPLLEGASLVDDESLQEKWASLLASASHPRTAPDVSHLFPIMLANLSPREAQFLDIFFNHAFSSIFIKIAPIGAATIVSHSQLSLDPLTVVLASAKFRWKTDTERPATLENLVNQGILKRNQSIAAHSYKALAGKIFAEGQLDTPYHCPDNSTVDMEDVYELTVTGAEFVMACRPFNHRPWLDGGRVRHG